MTKRHMRKPIAFITLILFSSLFIFSLLRSRNISVPSVHQIVGKRNLKGSKSSKSTKGTKSSKSSKSSKSKKSTKSSNNSSTTDEDPSNGCVKVKAYKSDGSSLDDIIESLVKSQDFSSYCRDDFDVAREWFLDTTNHPPPDLPQDDDEHKNYMTVRLSASSFRLQNLTTAATTHF